MNQRKQIIGLFDWFLLINKLLVYSKLKGIFLLLTLDIIA